MTITIGDLLKKFGVEFKIPKPILKLEVEGDYTDYFKTKEELTIQSKMRNGTDLNAFETIYSDVYYFLSSDNGEVVIYLENPNSFLWYLRPVADSVQGFIYNTNAKVTGCVN